MSQTTIIVLAILIQHLSAATFPEKSLMYSVLTSTTTEIPESTTQEQIIDISAVNVTNLSVEDINKIAEALPPVNTTARKADVFIVYAQSVEDVPKAVALPEQEAYIVEAQKLMSMVADDLEADASNSYALSARSRGTDRLTPEERKNKLHMLFRVKKNATHSQEVPKTKRYSYTDNFEPLKVNRNNNNSQGDFSTPVPETTTINNQIDAQETSQESTTASYYFPPPPRQQLPPNTVYAYPPANTFEPPNKQFYGYVRHDLHLIDSANKQQQQPYVSLQQPVYERPTNFGEKNVNNFQAHVQHPSFYRGNPYQGGTQASFNQFRESRPVASQFSGAANPESFNQLGGMGQNQVYQNYGQGFPLTPQQQSFFGRILPMFG